MRAALAAVLILGCNAWLTSTLHAQACPDEGECDATVPCDARGGCPVGLECDATRIVESCPTSPGGESDAAVPNDGACTRDEIQVEEPECVYAPVLCTQDSECEPFHACQLLGSESECDSARVPSCPPGQSCDAPSEPVCTRTDLRFCFPMRVDCTDSSECMEGWRCTTLPQNAFADHPDGWEGATAICVPEGIALLLEGRVEARGESSSSADRAEASGESETVSDPESEAGSSCSISSVPAARSDLDLSNVLGLLVLVVGLAVSVRSRRDS